MLLRIFIFLSALDAIKCENSNTTEETISFLTRGEKLIKLDKNHKDAIILLGLSGSGKSTLAFFLAGDNDNLLSVRNNDTGDYFIKDIVGDKISDKTIISKTLFPELIVDEINDIAFYDCPGFKDTRNASTDIAASYFTNKILTNLDRIKIVFVLSHISLRNRHDILYFIQHAAKLITNVEKYKHSIGLVVSKVGNSLSDKDAINGIGNTLTRSLNELKNDLSDQSKYFFKIETFLNIILTKKGGVYSKIQIFRAPQTPGVISSIKSLQDGKKYIFNLINDLQYKRIEENDFGFSVSDSSELHILESVNYLVTKIHTEMDKYKTDAISSIQYDMETKNDIYDLPSTILNLNTDVQKFLKNYVFDESKISINYLSEFDKIFFNHGYMISDEARQNVIKFNNYLEFFIKLSNTTSVTKTEIFFQSFSQVQIFLDKLNDWFTFLYQMHNKLSQYEFQIEKQNILVSLIGAASAPLSYRTNTNLKTVLNFLKQFNIDKFGLIEKHLTNNDENQVYLKQMNIVLHSLIGNKVETSINDGEIQFEGLYIDLIDVIKTAKAKNCFKIIVLAYHTVFITADIELQSVNTTTYELQIFAPIWSILNGNKVINFNGTNARDFSNRAADSNRYDYSGNTGSPGLPGTNAGSFFGLASEFETDNFLTVMSKGGNGGSGQNGGNGHAGRDGKQAEVEYYYDWGIKNLEEDKLKENGFIVHYYGRNLTTDILTPGGIAYTTYSTFYYYGIWGTNGSRGSNGGDGGHNGYKGYGGVAEVIHLGVTDKIKLIISNGSDGAMGNGGIGGKGGKTGNKLDVIVEHITKAVSTFFVTKLLTRINSTNFENGYEPSGNNGEENQNSLGIIEAIQPQNEIMYLDNYLKFKKILTQFVLQRSVVGMTQTDFLKTVNVNEKIVRKYSIHDFIKEYTDLEEISSKIKSTSNSHLIKVLEEFLNRIETFYSISSRSKDLDIVFRYLHLATYSKIVNLKTESYSTLVIDFLTFFSTLSNEIDELKVTNNQLQVREQVNNIQMNFKSKINAGLNEIQILIKRINNEVQTTIEGINDGIQLHVQEIRNIEQDLSQERKDLELKKQDLKDAAMSKFFIGIIKLAGKVASVFGNVGHAVGELVGEATSVYEDLTAKEERVINKVKVPQSVNFVIKEIDDEIYVPITNEITAFQKQVNVTLATISDPSKNSSLIVNQTLLKEIIQIQKEINGLSYLSENVSSKIFSLNVQLSNVVNSIILDNTKTNNRTKRQLEQDSNNQLNIDTINVLKKQVAILGAAFKLVKDFTGYSKEEKMLNVEIDKNVENIKRIKSHENQVYGTIMPAIHNIRKQLSNLVNNNLASQSVAALDVIKYYFKKTLRSLKLQLKQFTAEFKSQTFIVNAIEKLDEAMSTLLVLYTRIDDLKVKKMEADYVANIYTSNLQTITTNDPKLSTAINLLDVKIRTNIMLDKYNAAINNFKQWTFPFAAYYLQQYAFIEKNHQKFNELQSASDIIKTFTSKLIQNSATIIGNIDKHLISEYFSSNSKVSHPFYTWKYTHFKQEVSMLLSGKTIVLNANILNSKPLNALKFNMVKLHLRSTDEHLQSELDTILKSYKFVLTHLGNSHYRCGQFFYTIYSDKISIEASFETNNGVPVSRNEVYEKMKSGAVTLSPYALWQVQLVKVDGNDLTDLKNFNSDIDIELVGQGKYINNEAKICDFDLSEYYPIDKELTEKDIDNRGSEITEGNEKTSKRKRKVLKLDDSLESLNSLSFSHNHALNLIDNFYNMLSVLFLFVVTNVIFAQIH